MDLFGYESPAQTVIDVKNDQIFIDGEARAWFVHDECVNLFYVGEDLGNEDHPYGCADSLDEAIEDWRSKLH